LRAIRSILIGANLKTLSTTSLTNYCRPPLGLRNRNDREQSPAD